MNELKYYILHVPIHLTYVGEMKATANINKSFTRI